MATLKNEAIRILTKLISVGVPDVNAKLITAQAMNESGNFGSHVFIANNNAFGMKMPSIRPHSHIKGVGTAAPAGEGGGNYAAYASVEDSALDVLDLYTYRSIVWNDVQTPDTFVNWLKFVNYYQGNVQNYITNVAAYFAMMSDINSSLLVSVKKKRKNVILIIVGALSAALVSFVLFFRKKRSRKYGK